MVALLVQLSPVAIPAWLAVLSVLAIIAIPVSEWVRRDVHRVRFTVAFAVAVCLGGAVAFAAYPPPGVWDNCCQWLIPYGICWPIEWC